jgi:3-hydroxyisobutyrate dehydrogenase-like beta-hydroxyacid dehydrogenase
VEVLAKGGGGGIALERLKPFLLAQDPSGLRFSIANAQKDLGYYQTMAQDAGAHDAVASAVLATLNVGAEHAASGAWVPELVRVLGEA